MSDAEHARLREVCEAFLRQQPPASDAAHDLGHVRRVVRQAEALAREVEADLRIVLPAAYLHDCVAVAKDAPGRAEAARRAADTAVAFLREQHYPDALLPAVAHAIAAHSYSAGVSPETVEAQVVQDADRLDALGAVGIARALLVGGALGLAFADADDPFCDARLPDDRRYALDHFYAKLLGLAATMQTAAGRREAAKRTAFLRHYLDVLREEIGA